MSDKAKLGGSYCRGYGIIPKFVMTDPDLSLSAKGIYAFLCCYASGDNTCFPGRDLICTYLDINKDTYYKRRKELLDFGYISITQIQEENQQYANNLFTLHESPKKFKDNEEKYLLSAQKRAESTGQIIVKDMIHLAGYGMMPKAVILDKRLSIREKAMMAYFWAYAGPSPSAFPSVTQICRELSIGNSFYQQAIKRLKELQYVNIKQRRSSGAAFSVNDFYILSLSEEDINNPELYYASRYIGFPDTEIPYTGKPDAEIPYAGKPYTENPDTINNKHTTNISNNNTQNPINPSTTKDRYDGWKKRDFEDLFRKTIPISEVEVMYPQINAETNEEIVSIMASACLRPSKKIGDTVYNREEIVENYLKIHAEHIAYVIECVENTKTAIKNIEAYYAKALFCAPNTIELYYKRRVEEDEGK